MVHLSPASMANIVSLSSQAPLRRVRDRIVAAHDDLRVRVTDMATLLNGQRSINVIVTEQHCTRMFDICQEMAARGITVISGVMQTALYRRDYIAFVCQFRYPDQQSGCGVVFLDLRKDTPPSTQWDNAMPSTPSKVLKVSWMHDGRLICISDETCVLISIVDGVNKMCFKNYTLLPGRIGNDSYNACVVAGDDNNFIGTLHMPWIVDTLKRDEFCHHKVVDSVSLLQCEPGTTHSVQHCISRSVICLVRAADGLLVAATKTSVFVLHDKCSIQLHEPAHTHEAIRRTLAVNEHYILLAHRMSTSYIDVVVFRRDSTFSVALHKTLPNGGILMSADWISPHRAQIVRSLRVEFIDMN